MPSNIVILSGDCAPTDRDLSLAESWVERCPTIPDPYYYRAAILLSRRKYGRFLADAEKYLFLEQSPGAAISTTMMRYYIAQVHCYNRRDHSEATRYLASCLMTRPLMAEFWCLLGDVYYHLLDAYDKAMEFYENAMVLGSRRLASDPYPMEISKYKTYPEMMIENCEKILVSTGYPVR